MQTEGEPKSATRCSLNATILVDRSRRKTSESYLFTGREADQHDLESIYALGVNGFLQLTSLNAAFRVYEESPSSAAWLTSGCASCLFFPPTASATPPGCCTRGSYMPSELQNADGRGSSEGAGIESGPSCGACMRPVSAADGEDAPRWWEAVMWVLGRYADVAREIRGINDYTRVPEGGYRF
ncbi:hypothetical protein C8J57DRAFT_1226616 [Mycena rebaudengoi]|nr:hypothetical protein C8J57DRAFT_1226616 [Mycena rebaudengoi]